MARLRSFLSRVVVCALAGAAVGHSSARAASFRLPGINYNTRLGPDWAVKCKDAAAVASDMATISQVADAVRLFSLTDCAQSELVVPAAISAGLRVSLGLWVSGDDSVFAAERAQLESLLQSHLEWFKNGKVADIHVGSEAIYRKDVTVQQNVAKLQDVRALLVEHGVSEVPVTIAEIGDTYLASPELMDAMDVVQANAFPFWEKVPVRRAVGYLRARMEPLLALASAKNKRVEIGETGWATQGENANASEASPVNAGRYFASFRAMATTYGWKFYYFEAFDAAWKAEAEGKDTVEAHFGLFSADGVLKSDVATATGSFESGNATGAGNSTTSNGSSSNNSTSSPSSATASSSNGTASSSNSTGVYESAPAVGLGQTSVSGNSAGGGAASATVHSGGASSSTSSTATGTATTDASATHGSTTDPTAATTTSDASTAAVTSTTASTSSTAPGGARRMCRPAK